jgi:hypothetical protein
MFAYADETSNRDVDLETSNHFTEVGTSLGGTVELDLSIAAAASSYGGVLHRHLLL